MTLFLVTFWDIGARRHQLRNLTPKNSVFDQKCWNASYGLNNPQAVFRLQRCWWQRSACGLHKFEFRRLNIKRNDVAFPISIVLFSNHQNWNIFKISVPVCCAVANETNKIILASFISLFYPQFLSTFFFIKNFHFLFIQNTIPTKSFVSIRISQNSRVPNFWNFLQSRGHL